MSYDVSFRRVVLQSEPVVWREPFYLGFEEIGNSSLRNGSSIVRDWDLAFLGRSSTFMEQVVTRSVSCEGGELQMTNGRTRPENYIRQWRSALSQAKPLEAYLKRHVLSVSFHSLVKKIRRKQATLSLGMHRITARRFNDLIIRLCTNDGLEELDDRFVSDTLPLTRLSLTRANLVDNLTVIDQVLAEVGSRLPVWNTNFAGWVFDELDVAA